MSFGTLPPTQANQSWVGTPARRRDGRQSLRNIRPTLLPPQAGGLAAQHKSVMRRGFSDPDALMPRPIMRFARENRSRANEQDRWSSERTTSFAAVPAQLV